MSIRFMGKVTSGGDSPTLWATERETYIIQGYKITDPAVAVLLDISEGETCVEIYAMLLANLAKDGIFGVVRNMRAPIVHVLPNGNYIVRGRRLTDPDAREQMSMPDHEDAIEVPKAVLAALLEDPEDAADDTRAAGRAAQHVRA
ncbi:hypothetical protein LO762_25360 [Actinocorallia sp. API 0066]|uniref:hypothetical protein n=1 Tax=Actinocorallia sp. API 0066 TaxID=2896846 RepID=UPI001E3149A1|nr:hypothetical protein [Actinocorallia sp. API 0066]MCD0452487.1 hypothetical protein [Actinocorallia sp. API 0066]